MKIDDFDTREQVEEYSPLFYQFMGLVAGMGDPVLLNELFSNSEKDNVE